MWHRFLGGLPGVAIFFSLPQVSLSQDWRLLQLSVHELPLWYRVGDKVELLLRDGTQYRGKVVGQLQEGIELQSAKDRRTQAKRLVD